MMKILSSTKNTRSILPESYRYIRSDVPVCITEEDKEWLLDNNVRTIVDLREESEQKRKHCPLSDRNEFEYITIPITGGKEVPLSPDLVAASYVQMVDAQMINVIHTIECSPNNVLYFCNAGKDRTGVVSAILLKRYGMDDAYIISDYMKSAANLQATLIDYVSVHPDVDLNVITPKEKYIREFLDNKDIQRLGVFKQNEDNYFPC